MATTAPPGAGADLSQHPPPPKRHGPSRSISLSSRAPVASSPVAAAPSPSYHHATPNNEFSEQKQHLRRASSSARPPRDLTGNKNYDPAQIIPSPKRTPSRDRQPQELPASHRARGAEAQQPQPGHPQLDYSNRNNYLDKMAPSAVANSSSSPSRHAHGPSDAQSAAPPKQSRSRTTIPTQSGKWILGKTIGEGSMGKVKLARKEDGSEQVACKIIPRGSTDNHQSRADKERADHSKEVRTAREAAIVTLLNHPHICGLRDVVRTNYHWYMLFEYVNGGQMLDYIISHGKLKEKQARKFSRQIASALDYCHRNSIVHRDLKIENILISKTGDIKIIDYGLSNLFSPRGHLKTFCGSLYFAAPELLQARAYTGPEVDVWSFGIVLYVLVCGKVPFDDQSMPALHAKIKKGQVDYPSWLSSECKHLMSRMLVTDPKQRASMQEVMNHPWMVKGHGGSPDNYLPAREPLQLPLDPEVIHAMQGFNFGSPDAITAQLTKIIESEEYQQALRLYQREKELAPPVRDGEKKRAFGFDFYKRRNSSHSRDTLTGPSSDALQLGQDPFNAFSPLLSIYYLVREKQDKEALNMNRSTTNVSREKEKEREQEKDRDRERERNKEKEKEKDKDKDKEKEKEKDRESDKERPAKNHNETTLPILTAPRAAHVNTTSYEMTGEKPTGGRTRPRARTQGEDDEPDAVKHLRPKAPEKLEPTPSPTPTPKKEGTAAGLLRRFSTRKRRDPPRHERDRSHPPVVHVHTPSDSTPTTPRKSFSVRRSRHDTEDDAVGELRSSASQQHHKALLSPPLSAGVGSGRSRKSGGLGRSTSVNSADLRRREAARHARDSAVTSGSDQSVGNEQSNTSSLNRGHGHSQSMTVRAKSLGHARRESVQQRRQRREAAREANVPEETDLEPENSGVSTDRLPSSDLAKPVFLKGLFSVSTTSGKSVPAIRADIRRVLRQLNVEFTEIKGGFSCKHSPSIDLNKVHDAANTSGQSSGHRRRFSFGGLKRGDDDTDHERLSTPRASGRSDRDKDRSDRERSDRDRSFSNSETSVDSIPRRTGPSTRRAPGETSTQVQSDLGGSMVLEFEIFIVKVPLLSLHGIQFKRMTGNTWQYKNMADQILKELKL